MRKSVYRKQPPSLKDNVVNTVGQLSLLDWQLFFDTVWWGEGGEGTIMCHFKKFSINFVHDCLNFSKLLREFPLKVVYFSILI